MSRPSALARWVIAGAILLPAALPYLNHYFVPDGPRTWPTGFIFQDAPDYAANLREHFDTGQFRWLYANGHDWTYDTEHIYFQPWSLAVALLWQVSGRPDPGLAWVVWGVLAGWLCCRAMVAVVEHVTGLTSKVDYALLMVLAWGGGLMAAAGALVSLAQSGTLNESLRFDPVGGWWALNLGRNLVYPHESFLHALFLFALLAGLTRRWGVMVALAAVLSASHPWTGIQLPLVLIAWLSVEWLVTRPRDPSIARALAGVALVAAGHAAYYKGFLGQFPRHQVVERQMAAMNWVYHADTMLLAFCLAGAAALWCLRTPALARAHLSSAANRLWLCLALVTLALTNHDLVVPNPIQPLHFDRVYVFAGLCLLGLPAFRALFERLGEVTRPTLRAAAVAGALVVLLSDNLFFFGAYLVKPADRARYGFKLTGDERQVVAVLNRPELAGSTVVCSRQELEFLVPALTPLRAWASITFTIPDNAARQAERTRFWRTGEMPPAWESRRLVFVEKKGAAGPGAHDAISRSGATRRLDLPTYEVWY